MPEILDGAISPIAKSKDFIQSIGTPSVNSGLEGRISVEQFIDYYLSKSLVFLGSDEDFKGEVLSEWGVDSDLDESTTPAPQLSAKQPLPPCDVPSTSQYSSPRAKKSITAVTIEDNGVRIEEYDAQYRQLYPVASHQSGVSPRKSSSDIDLLIPLPKTQLTAAPLSHQQRFASPVLQPPLRVVPKLALRDQQLLSQAQTQSQQHANIKLESPLSTAHPSSNQHQLLHVQQHHHQQHHQQNEQEQQGNIQVFKSAPNNRDHAVSNNLNSLLMSLQQKLFQQQQTIESQHQVITAQQHILDQLRTVLDQQKH